MIEPVLSDYFKLSSSLLQESQEVKLNLMIFITDDFSNKYYVIYVIVSYPHSFHIFNFPYIAPNKTPTQLHSLFVVLHGDWVSRDYTLVF